MILKNKAVLSLLAFTLMAVSTQAEATNKPKLLKTGSSTHEFPSETWSFRIANNTGILIYCKATKGRGQSSCNVSGDWQEIIHEDTKFVTAQVTQDYCGAEAVTIYCTDTKNTIITNNKVCIPTQNGRYIQVNTLNDPLHPCKD